MKRALTAVHHRLMPFYISRLLEGVIFWFAIEKVYMTSLGFTASGIGLAIVLMSAVVLLSEIPLGVIADRTSRKTMAIFSLAMLGLATGIMSQASEPLHYMIGLCFFGVYSASSSGLNDSIIYDVVLEEEGSRANFETYYGRERLYGSAGLVVSSLFGAWMAKEWGLDATYVWTLPFTLMAMVSLLFLREPKLHKATEATFILSHLSETLSEVRRAGIMRWIVIALVSVGLVSRTLLDVDQLWPLALAMPLLWFGPLNAGLLTAFGLAGFFASRANSWNRVLGGLLLLLLVGVLGLTIPRLSVIIPAQLAVLLASEALFMVANGKLHDNVQSKYRAGASSMISSLTSLLFMMFVLVFSKVADWRSIFWASILLVPVVLVALYAVRRTVQHD